MLSGDVRFHTLPGASARSALSGLGRWAFQQEAWVDAVASARGRPHRLVAVRAEGGEQAGACLFGAVHRRLGLEVFESMPMGGYGGWILDDLLTVEAERALTRAWLRRCPWPVARITTPPGRSAGLPDPRPSASLAWPQRLLPSVVDTHVLELQDDNAMLARAQPRFRSYLRKIDTMGYTCRRLSEPQAAHNVAQWYRASSAHWQVSADTLLPETFFSALAAGAHAVWEVTHSGSVVGAALFLIGRSEVQYQASGSTRTAAAVSPMEALLWSAARQYRDEGFRTLNLGASLGLDSVSRFKEKFGAARTSYCTATYVWPRLLRPGHRAADAA